MSINNLSYKKLLSLIEKFHKSDGNKHDQQLAALLYEKHLRESAYYHDREIMCSCHDSITCPVIAKNEDQGWALYSLSDIHGMGHCEHNNLMFRDKFQEIVALNSTCGTSYIAVRHNDLWGLIKLSESDTPYVTWEFIEKHSYPDMHEMLVKLDININDFYVATKLKFDPDFYPT